MPKIQGVHLRSFLILKLTVLQVQISFGLISNRCRVLDRFAFDCSFWISLFFLEVGSKVLAGQLLTSFQEYIWERIPPELCLLGVLYLCGCWSWIVPKANEGFNKRAERCERSYARDRVTPTRSGRRAWDAGEILPGSRATLAISGMRSCNSDDDSLASWVVTAPCLGRCDPNRQVAEPNEQDLNKQDLTTTIPTSNWARSHFFDRVVSCRGTPTSRCLGSRDLGLDATR